MSPSVEDMMPATLPVMGGDGNSNALPFPAIQYVNYNNGAVGTGDAGFGDHVPPIKMENSSNNNNNNNNNNNFTQPPTSSHPSSEGSASGFLNGFFGNGALSENTFGSNNNNNNNSIQNNNLLYGQTPPSNMATSYETRHFGKRMRAGSISGRLRSMSDLQDRGIIDQQQKGIMKDLIISGNDDLQSALDKYEAGDTSKLVTMINSGALNNKDANDIDILADLDLGFLNVNEDFGCGVTGGVADIIVGEGSCETSTKSMPIPMNYSPQTIDGVVGINRNSEGGVGSLHSGSGSTTPSQIGVGSSTNIAHHPHTSSSSATAFDGIGELDFNGDYDAESTPFPMSQAPSSSTFNNTTSSHSQQHHPHQHLPQQQQPQTSSSDVHTLQALPHPGYRPRSDSIADIQRFRANSLAFGDLFEEPNPDDQQSVGKWMDHNPPIITNDNNNNNNNNGSSQIVGANGGLYILNNRIPATTTTTSKQRVKEEKKAMRDRERLQKKAMRDRERS